ncbi:transmembrane protein 126A [Battus philenor]|uniref:transmembrane protein 126A n=1 Tax=Battus philenor TaxID=42288 RepID=UPI0035CEA4D2
MALIKSSQIPKDAVVLTEVEAASYIWDVVNNWESLSDTWALRYAPAILGSINGVCGVLINSHYRKKLKLGTYGYFASVIPISLMPGVLTALFHRHLVSTDMLLMKTNACPLCYEMRSGITQVVLGSVYPMLLGPTSALMFATRYSTYRVPELRDGAKVIFKFLKSKTVSFTGTLTSMVAIQMVASSILTYYEMKNNISLKSKLMEIEKKVISEHELA